MKNSKVGRGCPAPRTPAPRLRSARESAEAARKGRAYRLDCIARGLLVPQKMDQEERVAYEAAQEAVKEGWLMPA